MQIPRTQTYTRFVRQEQQVSEHYVKLRTGTPDHSVGRKFLGYAATEQGAVKIRYQLEILDIGYSPQPTPIH